MITTTTELSIGWQHFYGWLGPIMTLIAAFLAGIFAYYQYQINKRVVQLQDYVAITIVPFVVDNIPRIQVFGVGRTNLYLHKYEIDGVNETYSEARLLACGSNMAFIIPVPQHKPNTEMPVRFYLTDEFGDKYISTGAIIIDQQFQVQPSPVPNPEQQTPAQVQATQQLIMRSNIRAWSYKTEKYEWTI